MAHEWNVNEYSVSQPYLGMCSRSPPQTPRAWVLKILRSIRASFLSWGGYCSIFSCKHADISCPLQSCIPVVSLTGSRKQSRAATFHSNLKMTAGQTYVGVPNLTLWPVSAGLIAFLACSLWATEADRDCLLCVLGLWPHNYILVCFPIYVYSREPLAKFMLLIQGRESIFLTLGVNLSLSFCGKIIYLKYRMFLFVVFWELFVLFCFFSEKGLLGQNCSVSF